MRKVYFLLILILSLTNILSAQNIPGGPARSTAVPVNAPAAYSANALINYVRTWEPNMPTSDPAAVGTATDVNAVNQTTLYLDGLGRPLQTVAKGASPSGKDIVTPVRYDAFGREQFQYLNYVPKSGNLSDGKFKTDPFNGQVAFYKDIVLNPGAENESVYYKQTEFDASPLNRPLKIYAAGNTWAKNDPAGVERGGNRPVELQYLNNTAADAVRIWDLPAAGVVPLSASGRVYAAGQLSKTVGRDERGMRTVEFRDKEDRLILKRKELVNGAADGDNGWLSTYYIYNDLGALCAVLPPRAVELIKSTWVIDAATAKELCYFYRYDTRGRMIVKKLPGSDSTEMVYDLRNRMVFIRDGNLKVASQPGGAKWLATFYDNLNRPVMTALYNSAATRESLQAGMNSATANTQAITHAMPAEADLLFATHDGRNRYVARNSLTFQDGFEVASGETTAEINATADQDTFSIAAANPLPGISASALTPLTYTFYDNYSYTGRHNAVTADFTAPQYAGNAYAEVVTTATANTQGLVTGTRVRVLGTDQWLTTTVYYTDKGRQLQVITDNSSGGKDVLTSMYSFNGKLISNFRRHTNSRSSTNPQTTIMTQMLYDAAGRVTQMFKQLNGGAKRTIASYTYNELGQVQKKRIGLKPADNKYLDSLQYEYNIRGWLSSINKAFVNTAGSSANWFGQEISYDYGFTANQVNGNIAGVKWKSLGDGVSRAYGYNYDNVNRLVTADFTQRNTATAGWTRDKMDYSVSNLTYDANGNIGAMTQKGVTGANPPAVIDQLSYTYQANSNKLIGVSDPNNTAAAKLGDFINGANTGDDYDYDANGNLKKDLNRNITAISYNHLNQPEIITVSGKGTVSYQYDALGNKLRKKVIDNTRTPSVTTVTDYISGLVYRNDTLAFIAHEEGRIRPLIKPGEPVAYYYDYFLKDHLNNVRTVLTEQTDLSVYTATMEAEQAAVETALFSNVDETRTVKPVGYPQSGTTSENSYVARLNAKDGGKKIGPSVVLRVMAGDTVQIGARAFYKSTGPENNRSVTAEDMVASLLQAFGGDGASASTHNPGQAQRSSPFANINGNDYQKLKDKDPDQVQADKPKAYLNFVLFDDQFNLVEDNSGVRQVKGEPDKLQALAVDKMPVKKNGFLYVYTSNETTQDVMFDDLSVMLAGGPLLEETHYYPFGLPIAAISNNVLKGTNYLENRYKYNGKELQSGEFEDGTGLELYDYGARMYDAQIARFGKIDRFAELDFDVSPYQYGYNNPVLNVDINGDSVVPASNVNWANFDIQNNTIGLNTVTVSQNSASDNGEDNAQAAMDLWWSRINEVSHNVLSNPEFKPMVNQGMGLVGAATTFAQYHLEKNKLSVLAKLRKSQKSMYWRELKAIDKSLAKVGTFAKVSGYIGVAINGAVMVDKYMNGDGITAGDVVDMGVSIALTAVAVSNPVALVGLGIYGFLDSVGALDDIKAKLGGETVILSRKLD